jgi:hypothetical protein
MDIGGWLRTSRTDEEGRTKSLDDLDIARLKNLLRRLWLA